METIARLIGAGVGFGAGWLSTHLGVTVSPEAQTAVTVAVYGAAHRGVTWISKRLGHKG